MPRRYTRKTNTALYQAVSDGNLTQLQALIAQGAHPREVGKDGVYPLVTAIANLEHILLNVHRHRQAHLADALEIISILLEHGANPYLVLTTRKTVKSALSYAAHLAAHYCHPERIEQFGPEFESLYQTLENLLTHNKMPPSKKVIDNLALWVACQYDDERTIRLLLAHHARPDAKAPQLFLEASKSPASIASPIDWVRHHQGEAKAIEYFGDIAAQPAAPTKPAKKASVNRAAKPARKKAVADPFDDFLPAAGAAADAPSKPAVIWDNPHAYGFLALCYAKGLGTFTNKQTAIYYYHQARKAGYQDFKDTHAALGKQKEAGNDDKIYQALLAHTFPAETYPEVAADINIEAKTDLALERMRHIDPAIVATGLESMSELSQTGHPYPQSTLASFYITGQLRLGESQVDRDFDKALPLILSAANQGCPIAAAYIYLLSTCHLHHNYPGHIFPNTLVTKESTVKIKGVQARKLYMLSQWCLRTTATMRSPVMILLQNLIDSCSVVGDLLSSQLSIPPVENETQQSMRLFPYIHADKKPEDTNLIKQFAIQRHPLGIYCYLKWVETNKESFVYQQLFPSLQEAADTTNAYELQFCTGDLLIIAGELALGETYIKRAAEQGDMDSQKLLAKLYDTIGDHEKVYYWRERAAFQNSPNLQFDLACDLVLGIGTPFDVTAAKEWLTMASQRDHPEAKKILGHIQEGDDLEMLDYEFLRATSQNLREPKALLKLAHLCIKNGDIADAKTHLHAVAQTQTRSAILARYYLAWVSEVPIETIEPSLIETEAKTYYIFGLMEYLQKHYQAAYTSLLIAATRGLEDAWFFVAESARQYETELSPYVDDIKNHARILNCVDALFEASQKEYDSPELVRMQPRWLNYAAKHQHPEALYQMGKQLIASRDKTARAERGTQFLLAAAQQGHEPALQALCDSKGYATLDHIPTIEIKEVALATNARAINQGVDALDPEALILKGYSLLMGENGFEADPSRALALFITVLKLAYYFKDNYIRRLPCILYAKYLSQDGKSSLDSVSTASHQRPSASQMILIQGYLTMYSERQAQVNAADAREKPDEPVSLLRA